MVTNEFESDTRICNCCERATLCTYLKAAHVPLYAWVCSECRDEWVYE